MMAADDEHFHPAQTLFPAVHVAVHPPPFLVHTSQDSDSPHETSVQGGHHNPEWMARFHTQKNIFLVKTER